MPKVSVIVPVYKAESTLARCVDSILAQTYTDFELLLIDDGSPDNSGTLCDEYAKQDPRVRVFHKPNGGVSSARNLGLDKAQGEWISFVDSDDFITEDFLSTAMSHPGEIKILQEITFETENFVIPKVNPECLEEFHSDDISKVYEWIGTDFWNCRHTTVWGKVFDKNLFTDIRFDEKMTYGEDTYFMLRIFGKVKSLSVIPGIFYIYIKPYHLASKYRLSLDDSIVYIGKYTSLTKTLPFSPEDFGNNIYKIYTHNAKKDIYSHPIKFISHPKLKKLTKEIYKIKFPTLFLCSSLLGLISETIRLRLIFQWRRITKSV